MIRRILRIVGLVFMALSVSAAMWIATVWVSP